MANFESPLGNKKINTVPMKEFDVPDESGYTQQNIPTDNGEPVVRRRNMPPIDVDAIRDFQAKMQAQDMPSYDNDPSELERQIRQSRADKKQGIERLNMGAKKRIEMLIGMTRTTRSVDIEENTFILQTLKSKEMREAIVEASAFDGSVQAPYEIRKQFLARSLTHIAGLEIEQFLGSNTLEAKLIFLDELDEHLLNRLYNEYLQLVSEAKDKFSVKSKEEAQEVIEDLKK